MKSLVLTKINFLSSLLPKLAQLLCPRTLWKCSLRANRTGDLAAGILEFQFWFLQPVLLCHQRVIIASPCLVYSFGVEGRNGSLLVSELQRR